MITLSERRARAPLRVPALAWSVLLFAGLLTACSTPAKRAQSDLDVLGSALPGVYHDVTAAAPESTLTFSIARVRAQIVGDVVYFVRETAADNARLVYAERIWTLTLSSHGELVQRMYLFKDPRRWIGAAEHQELLLSLLPDDLAPLQRCELIWRKTATGFEASPAHDDCQPGTATSGQSIERAAKFQHGQLSLTERSVGTDGSLSSSSGPAATLLLQRGGASASSSSVH